MASGSTAAGSPAASGTSDGPGVGRGDAGGQERGKGVVRVLVHADPLAAAGTQHVQQPVGVLFLVDPVLLEQHLVNNAVLAGRCAGRGLGIGFKVERAGRRRP